MITRLFLAAGVAALAIAAPAAAERGGKGGGDRQRVSAAQQGGGGQRAQRLERRSAASAQRAQRAPRIERQQARANRIDRQQVRANRIDRQQARANRIERQQLRANRMDRQQARANRIERQQLRANRIDRQQARANRIDRQQLRANRIDRQQARANRIDRQQLRATRIDRVQNRAVERQLRQAQRVERIDHRAFARNGDYSKRGVRMGWAADCPPGLMSKGCNPPGQTMNANRIANADAFRYSRFAALSAGRRILAPTQVVSYVGSPLSSLSSVVALNALPPTVSYLYPDTDDYYYRYGDGYLYRVERDNDLIDWVLPLLAGGFMPGQMMPTAYMNSYVPNYYGLSSFYQDTPYVDYRYVNGNIYAVDPYSGMIEDVIPMYASGYGVGQMIPAGYSYYNVPYQYRDVYYANDDYNYWYAPGAIYQYDTKTSLITSIAALLAPGLTVGQQLPMSYNVYNVPYQYRSTYYDTPNAWYRYNNGYIYQVDPTTQLVTAIVASILT